MKTSRKFMRPHKQCPYYENGECSRKGCLFLTPCTAMNEPHTAKTFVRIIRSRGS